LPDEQLARGAPGAGGQPRGRGLGSRQVHPTPVGRSAQKWSAAKGETQGIGTSGGNFGGSEPTMPGNFGGSSEDFLASGKSSSGEDQGATGRGAGPAEPEADGAAGQKVVWSFVVATEKT